MKVRERNTWTRASLNPEGLQDVMWCSPCLKVGRLLNESGQMFESPQLPTMLPGTLSPMPCPESPHFVPSLCSHLSHSPEAASVEMSPAPESSWLRPHGSSPISGCPAAHASTPRACCSWSWSSPSCLIDQKTLCCQGPGWAPSGWWHWVSYPDASTAQMPAARSGFPASHKPLATPGWSAFSAGVDMSPRLPGEAMPGAAAGEPPLPAPRHPAAVLYLPCLPSSSWPLLSVAPCPLPRTRTRQAEARAQVSLGGSSPGPGAGSFPLGFL